MTQLHYIFDPVCGWCYGAAPLISAARTIPGLKLVFHAGGMMTGMNRRPVTTQLRNYIVASDERIAQLTGQVFGKDYLDGLLRDSSVVLNSAPPSTAILAAEQLAGRGLDMLKQLQIAHYVHGLRIAEIEVLQNIANEMCLDVTAFIAAYVRLDGLETQLHFSDSREMLARVGGQGFPTLALEYADATFERIDLGKWLGNVEQWTDYLRHITGSKGDEESSINELACNIDGCSI
ncbi:DsbA family protein [Undibacterium jejuense]|uniref:DsbA family protein n=1 Tax=Undibacterium jejuense TaxID=1344949 RepID=A0A923HRP2_9BURK|nr:DsbA family protein [Undibacterium jejuense]MBC3863483.1 DsbA family protein [Undibacterium jejuense]